MSILYLWRRKKKSNASTAFYSFIVWIFKTRIGLVIGYIWPSIIIGQVDVRKDSSINTVDTNGPFHNDTVGSCEF